MTHPRPRTAGSPRALPWSLALGLVLGLSLIPLSTLAEAPPQENPEAAAVLPLGTEGLVVYRDAETGRFTTNPTDAQRALLRQALASTMAEALSRSDAGLTEVVLPNGAVMVDLEGRFQSTSFLARHADGSLHQACTHDLGSLEASLAGDAATPEIETDATPETPVETDRHGRAVQ